MSLRAACLVLLLIAMLALACENEDKEPTRTASPATAMTATPEATPSPPTPTTPVITPTQMAATREATPNSELGDEYEGWLTYTNDVYGYEFKYPPEATVTEAPEGWFKVPREEWEEGVTLHDVYERYTGKICVQVSYQTGWMSISAPVNEEFAYVNCGRTSRAFQGPDRRETLLIDGETYTAGGFEEQGPGETLQYHNEYLLVVLDDKTRIGYGSESSETATFADYLDMRDDLLRIVQSYRKLK